MTETKSTCPYCGTGCGVIIEHDGKQITGVRGDPVHPANFGRLCTKGTTLHLTATRQTAVLRATRPELRRDKQSPRDAVSWQVALDHAATKFADVIKTHGADAVAFYISGQLLTEDYYAFNKLAKGLIGTNNVETNSRLCMSSAVTGYKATLGADAPPSPMKTSTAPIACSSPARTPLSRTPSFSAASKMRKRKIRICA